MPCRRLLLLPAAAAVLLAPAVLATPTSHGAHAETTTTAAVPSGAPRLHLLRVQSREPDQHVYAEPCRSSTRVQDCDGVVRCLWDHLSQKVRTAAEKLGGDVEELADFIAYSHDDTLPIPNDDDDDDIGRVDGSSDHTQETTPLSGHGAKVNGNPDTPEGTHGWDHGDQDSHGSYPHEPPLLMTVALAAIAIGYLSLWGIHHLHRRTARLCVQDQSLPAVANEHRHRHGDFRSARRARRKVQQQAITIYVRGVLRRWTRGNAVAGEGKLAVGGKSMAVSAGEASTMEEDIARLREVADFIDDVVAAEQGMSPCVPETPLSRQAFADDDDCLPTCDTVTDGFRHAPGSSTRPGGRDRPKMTKNQGA